MGRSVLSNRTPPGDTPASLNTRHNRPPDTLRSAWQMYSNLNVSAHGSNHYLIPASLDLGGFLADSVQIAAASDPWLHRHYGQTGARMTWFELRRYLARQPDTRLLYVRAGHPPRVFGPTAQEPALTTPPP